MDIGEQNLAVLFGGLVDAPAVQLGMIHRPMSSSQTTQMEACPDSTGSYQNPQTTS